MAVKSASLNAEREFFRSRQTNFMILLIGYIGYYLCRANLSSAYPLLSHQFGYSNSQLGLIALYSEAVYAVGKFINGPLGDKIGGRPVFLIGMFGAIVFNLLFANFHDLYAFILIWCACRYFLSMGWGGIVKIIGAWYPPERNGTVMGFISINFQFGGVLASVFCGFLVSQGVGWQGLFLYPAGIVALLLVWSYLYLKENPESEYQVRHFAVADFSENDSNSNQIIYKLLGLPLYRQLLLFSFLTTFLRSIFFFWTPKFLVDIGMKDSNAIFSAALFPLLGCLGTIFLGWYTDRYSKNGDRAKMMWIMLVGLAIALLAVAFTTKLNPDAIQRNLIVLLMGASGFLLLGPYSMSAGCMTLDIAGPHAAATAAGWIDGIGYLGGALAAWGAGWGSDRLGWAQVFLILAVFALLSAGVAILMSSTLQKSSKLNNVSE